MGFSGELGAKMKRETLRTERTEPLVSSRGSWGIGFPLRGQTDLGRDGCGLDGGVL